MANNDDAKRAEEAARQAIEAAKRAEDAARRAALSEKAARETEQRSIELSRTEKKPKPSGTNSTGPRMQGQDDDE